MVGYPSGLQFPLSAALRVLVERVVGTQFDRATETRDRPLRITLLLQHRPQHVMRVGKLRIQRDRLPEGA